MLFQHLQATLFAILTLAIGGYFSWASTHSDPAESFDQARESRGLEIPATPTPSQVTAPGPVPGRSQRDGPVEPAIAESVSPPESVPAPVRTSVSSVATEAVTSPAEYTAESLEYLAEIGFGVEYGESAPVLHKWAEDLRIKVHGTPTSVDIDTLNEVVHDLNSLVGTINLQLTNQDANVEIYFLPESSFTSIEPSYVPVNLGFFRIWWNDAGVLYRARILVSSQGITQEERSHLIREELTQSLGLFRDSWRYSDSIFYQGWTNTNDYSDLDRSVISLLYDSRLHAGMARSQALDIVSALPDATCCAD